MFSIQINTQSQQLNFCKGSRIINTYSVATAAAGLGEKQKSYQTPRGWHVVHQKIGDHAPIGRIFHTRLDTQENYSAELAAKYPERDWILTRLIRLAGCEMGFNLGQEVDSLKRCIYIHGVPDQQITGQPNSQGCIRMRNHDIIALYDQIEVGTPVFIK